MTENEKYYSILNKLTVEEFLETYPESIQYKMSKLGYYVSDGYIIKDWSE